MKLRTKIQLFTSFFMFLFILMINASIYYLFYQNSVETELTELTEQTNTVIATVNENPEIPPGELIKAFCQLMESYESIRIGGSSRSFEVSGLF